MKTPGTFRIAVCAAWIACLLPIVSLKAQDATALPAGGSRAGTPTRRSGGTPTLVAPPEGSVTTGTPTRGGRGGTFGGTSTTPPQPITMTEGPSCTIDATIYELNLPQDQIAYLDIDKLSKAATSPVDFEKALGELGKARPLYHVNQRVRLTSDTIQVGSSVPYVTGSQVTNTGQRVCPFIWGWDNMQ